MDSILITKLKLASTLQLIITENECIYNTDYYKLTDCYFTVILQWINTPALWRLQLLTPMTTPHLSEITDDIDTCTRSNSLMLVAVLFQLSSPEGLYTPTHFECT